MVLSKIKSSKAFTDLEKSVTEQHELDKNQAENYKARKGENR